MYEQLKSSLLYFFISLHTSLISSLWEWAAFGPMNTDGRDNVSVIKSLVMPGFSLKGTLGEPKEAAERLLANVIAPPASGKTATLMDAYAQDRDGQPSYVFEYTVQKGDFFFQHSVSVIMSRGNCLFTLTAVAPEDKWATQEKVVKTIANSFRLRDKDMTVAYN